MHDTDKSRKRNHIIGTWFLEKSESNYREYYQVRIYVFFLECNNTNSYSPQLKRKINRQTEIVSFCVS